MRLIDADKIFPWYLKAFSADEIGEERAISPEEIRFSMNDIRGNLENIPTEHPHKWIPVSERLPEYGTEVLTCRSGGYVEIQSLETYGEYWEDQHGDWSDFDDVIAWQPLPESYKAESDGKE